MNQIGRLLTLIPYLQRHPGASMVAVAESFGISTKQLRNDLAVLWMCGLPGLLPGDLIEIDMDAVDNDGVIHLSNADYLRRPVALSAAEALTLMVGLQSLRDIAGPEAAVAITGALDKVRAALGDRGGLADQVAVEISSAAERVRQRLDQAIAAHCRVELEYLRDTDLTPQRRSVDPQSVALRDGYAYLEAWDCDRAGWRTFRLDRITAAVVTSIPQGDHGPVPAYPRPGRSWLAGRTDVTSVEVWLAADARWASETYPVEAIRPVTAAEAARLGVALADDDVVVTLLVADPEWLTRFLLHLGGAARVLDPVEVAVDAAARAAVAVSMHAELAQ